MPDTNSCIRPRSRRTLVVIGFVFVALLSACATTPDTIDPRAGDPNARLAALLLAWKRVADGGRSCQQIRPSDSPLVDCERIRKQIERLAIEFPNHPDVLFANAVIGFEAGRREEAEKDLDALRRIDPINAEATMLRARIAIADGNLRLARRLLDEQVALAPDHAGLHELSSSVYFLEEAYDEAGFSLEVALRLGAPAWRIAYHRGLIYEAVGRSDEAAESYRICIEGAPDFAPAISRLRALAVTSGHPR